MNLRNMNRNHVSANHHMNRIAYLCAGVEYISPNRCFPMNKYGARKTWSELCQRTFDSKAEAAYGESLRALEMAGDISNLEYQPVYELCGDKGHKARYTPDFRFVEKGQSVVVDIKGVMTEAARVRIAWLWEKYKIDVVVIK